MGRTAPSFVLAVALTWGSAAFASVSPDVLKQTRGAGAVESSDWPCIQRKVPELSAASVWSGPSLDVALQTWRDDPEIAGLARRLAARRMPTEDAAKAIADYAGGLDPAARAEKLTLLFAGLLQTLDAERSDIMNGIERYARKQKGLAEQIREKQSRLSDLNSAGNDPATAEALLRELEVDVRVFNDRRASLTFVCETPTLIEQRLFALARAIQAALPD